MQQRRAEILDRLADGPVTGPALAEQLDITRAAVWKHIEALREEGFEIASSESGYTLESIPEFGGSAIEFGLSAPFTVEFHDSIGSTNKRARELAEAGEQNTAVVADRQTGGRGRLDRQWSSPSGGIWLSVLLRPAVPAVHAPLFTLSAAVATTRAVRACGVDATIKWPNDVQVEGRKLAGILTEMEGEADRISWLVVGIGLNANVDASQLPGDRPATSLRAETGDVNRRELTQHLLEAFWELSEQTDSILPAWRELTSTLGQRVSVTTQTEEIVGEAVGIEFPGSLIVDTGTEKRTVSAGDCEHLRPAE